MSLIVIVFSLIAMVNKNKKKQQKTQERRPITVGMEPNAPKAVTTPAAPAQPATMLPPRPAAKPAAAQMSIDDYVARSAGKHGSMEGRTDHSAHISCEGHDPCHEEQLRPAVRPSRTAPAAAGATIAFREEDPALRLNFTGDELVRAFVMQEVLTRPCERVRRIGCR